MGISTETVGAEQSAPGKFIARGAISWPSPRQFFLVLLAYFGLQVVIRVLVSSSVDLDESEQVLFAQRLAWGYGPSPSLYTWLQILVFSLTGYSVLGLALLKNVILLAMFLLTYVNGRLITGKPLAGLAAAVSLLFIPQIAWESQRDLTHTVLASALAIATLSCFVQIQRGGETKWYALLGLVAGLGLLSKFNYGLWLAGLFGAGITLREFRPILLNRRLVLSLLLTVIVILPYGIWAASHPAISFHSVSKLRIDAAETWLKVMSLGLTHLLLALVSYGAPMALIYLLVFWKAPRQKSSGQEQIYVKLIARALLIIGGLAFLGILVTGSTGFRDRWFEPYFTSLPVLGVLLVADRLHTSAVKRLFALGLFVMALVALLIPGRILFGHNFGREEPLMRPYRELAQQLDSVLLPGAYVVCDDVLLAGNLRLGIRDITVATPETSHILANPARPAALVWEPHRHDHAFERLKAWAKQNLSTDITGLPPHYFTAPYARDRNKDRTLAWVQIK